MPAFRVLCSQSTAKLIEARARAIPVLVGLAVAVGAVPRLALSMNMFDSGIAASGATFTLHGLLPYRDYWLLYGPLTGLALAVPTAIVGPSLELLRIIGVGLVGVLAAVAYVIIARWTSPVRASLIAGLVVLVPTMINGLEPWPWAMAMTMGLAAILALASTGRGTVLIGVLLGSIFLTRLDVGSYALMAALVWPGRSRVVLGFVLVALPFAAVVFATTPMAAIFEQLVWYPLVGQPRFRSLPGMDATIPADIALWLTIPLVLLPRMLIVAGLVRAFVSRPMDRTLAGLAIFALFCQLQTLGRADMEHFAQASTPALLLIAPFVRERVARSSVVLGLVGGLMVSAMMLGYKVVNDFVVPGRDADLVRAARIVAASTTAGEPIYVGTTRHRYTLLNPLIAYYFAGRPPGTMTTMFNPGITNTDAIQARMVNELEASSTRVMLLDERYADNFEIRNHSRIAGSTILDEFIAENFQVMCRVGDFRVMVRVPDGQPVPACPEPDAQA